MKLPEMIVWTTKWQEPTVDSKLIALFQIIQNTTFIELAGIVFSMCLNICLQYDLVQMIRQPFKDKGSSIKFYIGISAFVSFFSGIITTS